MSLPLTNKAKLVTLYKKENDPKVKERLFLVIRVIEDWQVPFRVVREMNRSNPWASDWLKRYDKEGVEGLKDRPKIGRSPELSEGISYQIKKRTKRKQPGLDHKAGGRADCGEKRHKIPLYPHIPHPPQVGLQAEGAKKGSC